jgi:hypothetical protein
MLVALKYLGENGMDNLTIILAVSCFGQLPRQQPANWQRHAVAGARNLGAAMVI